MSPEETLAALTVKADECRELLSDMRSQEKTLHNTMKEAAELIAEMADSEIRKYLEERADAHLEILKKEYYDLEKRVVAVVTKKIDVFMSRAAASIVRERGLR